MRIQVFSQYRKLAEAGKVKPLTCPMHLDETAEFLLVHKEENYKIVLCCLACGYKNMVGIVMYENLLEIIRGVENDNSEELY